MAHHVIAFRKAVTVPAAYDALTAVSDEVFATASATGVFVPAGMRLVAAFGGIVTGGTWGRARLNAASLLRVAQPFITPLQSSVGSDNPNMQLLTDRPLLFPSSEVIGVDAALASVPTSADTCALLFFNDQMAPVPPGDGFWIRAEASSVTASTTTAWSTVAMTWDTTLPEGKYAVVGMVHGGPAIAARLVFAGQVLRPGVVSVTSAAYRTHAAFYEGGFGLMGSFSAFAPPSVQILATNTSVGNHEIYLRVVPL